MASSKLLTRFKSDKFSVLSRSLRPPILPAVAGYSWDGGREERGGEGLKWGAAAAGAILGLSGLAYNLRSIFKILLIINLCPAYIILNCKYLEIGKVIMRGKLIAVAYILRTY